MALISYTAAGQFTPFSSSLVDQAISTVCADGTVSYEMPSSETLRREVAGLTQAGEELGVKERLIVTWYDEAELDGGISVVPAWRFLLGL